MNRNLIAAAAIAAIALVTAPALAHDQSLHKGQATEGEVVSVQPGRFSMKTAGGEKTVTLGQKTKFEIGDAPARREDIRVGAHVAVFGTKLPGGEIVAKEVLVQPTPAERGGRAPGEHE